MDDFRPCLVSRIGLGWITCPIQGILKVQENEFSICGNKKGIRHEGNLSLSILHFGGDWDSLINNPSSTFKFDTNFHFFLKSHVQQKGCFFVNERSRV